MSQITEKNSLKLVLVFTLKPMFQSIPTSLLSKMNISDWYFEAKPVWQKRTKLLAKFQKTSILTINFSH